MQTLQLLQEAGPDKVLNVTIPVEKANQKYRLTITIEPESTPEERGWPPGYFERVIGRALGDSLTWHRSVPFRSARQLAIR